MVVSLIDLSLNKDYKTEKTEKTCAKLIETLLDGSSQALDQFNNDKPNWKFQHKET